MFRLWYKTALFSRIGLFLVHLVVLDVSVIGLHMMVLRKLFLMVCLMYGIPYCPH
ncbi:hypothetical protein RHMOL_Rhmol02G0282700 [Rhododendron molle]|uniref:Uncharacterized protein n=1 Tax=Rhododendron molle TaxID=49168 RepID=A0ACC0PV64_RHOML|nr:hypothetical protein RHMOL_Rhmol02G0282700 [Rhododendron molle]